MLFYDKSSVMFLLVFDSVSVIGGTKEKQDDMN